jgi:membrane dipeptidase
MNPSRRDFLLGAATAGLAAWPLRAQSPRWYEAAKAKLGMELSEAQLEAGVRFLERHPSVDVHCHPGRFFLHDVPHPTKAIAAYGAPFEEKVIAEMKAGRLSAGLFAAVADMSLLEFAPEKGLYATREFAPGEAYADYRRQLTVLKGLVGRGLLRRGRSVADVRMAEHRHETACVFAIEGGDFIEDRLERLHEAHGEGVRAITIVHYHINQIGDIQTAPPRHGGLTRFGASVVREMNRLGIIVDLAHAPLSVVKGAVDASTRPMMISHTNLVTPTLNHPRLVSVEQAKLVTSHGGIVGSIPWGIGQATVADWIESILRLVDRLGVDHVAIGTDMDANYMPVFTSYAEWPLLPAALLARGLHEREVAQILGGNFLRLFAANRG